MKRLSTIMVTMAVILLFITACSNSQSKEVEKGNKKTLVVGVDDKFAPMGYRNQDNEIVGFDIDYASAAAERLGVTLEFQPIDWKMKESELMSGRIDLIWNGYTITEERKEKVLFTNPYLKNAQVVVTLANSNISKLSDLEGEVVGLQSLSSASDALNDNPIQTKVKQVTEFSDNVLALNDLKNGRLDAVIIDEVVINYYMSKDKGTFKILEETLAPEEYGVGVKKGNEELLNQLQQALNSINEDGTASEISQKWFGEDKVLK